MVARGSRSGKGGYKGVAQERFEDDGIVLYPDCGGGYNILYMVKIHRTNGDLVFNRYIVSVGKDENTGDG